MPELVDRRARLLHRAFSVVPEPRRALLDAHSVRIVDLGRRCPTRQIAAVRRRADADDRNLSAVIEALAMAYASVRA